MTELFDKETGEIIEATPDSVTVAFACYMQEAAKQEHWIKHNHLTKPWRASIKERMAESGGLSAWKRAIQLASASEFLCGKIIGKNGTRFKLSLRFLVQPNSFVSILDGFYSNREPEPKKLVLPTMQPPHLKPQPAFEHDLKTPEERMAFTIAKYREHGKWADANRVEEALAKIQKRPAVLVPAPEVAFTSAPAKPPVAPRKPAPGPVVDVPWTDEDIPLEAYGDGA